HIPWSQTVIAGFSQGGAMTIDVARQFPVAGLICMSGYLHDDLTPVDSPPPTLIVHGQFDPVVPLEQAQALKSTLESWNTTVFYQEFAMGHEITPAAIATIRKFILKVCFS
ncbi:MAG: alpha/beta hydrolase, partial [Cyanobacteria bacterium P01_H01_bin.15]